MNTWVPGKVVAAHHWTETLCSLKIEAEISPFRAGQFTRLALDIDEKRIGRPYSFVNAPHERPLEFYFVTLPEGPLSTRLTSLQPGDMIWVAQRASGLFTLDQVPDSNTLWLLCTGTALGVFLSILKTDDPWRRFERVVLVHAVRRAEELCYKDTLSEFASHHPEQFTFIPFVSREVTDFAIRDRIPAAIDDGRLESAAGLSLSQEHSQIMICGNPAMVADTVAALEKRGLKRNRRGDPGQITTEKYW